MLRSLCDILKPGVEIVEPASLWLSWQQQLGIQFRMSQPSHCQIALKIHLTVLVLHVSDTTCQLACLLTIDDWVLPNIEPVVLVEVLVGITALTGHHCITNAMKLAEAGIVVTLDFLRLPLIAVAGVIFYNEAI